MLWSGTPAVNLQVLDKIRYLIIFAYERINEIPTASTYYLAKSQPEKRAWKTLLSLILVRLCEETREV